MIQKNLCSLSTKINKNSYAMVKVSLMINNVNIFTIYESLL